MLPQLKPSVLIGYIFNKIVYLIKIGESRLSSFIDNNYDANENNYKYVIHTNIKCKSILLHCQFHRDQVLIFERPDASSLFPHESQNAEWASDKESEIIDAIDQIVRSGLAEFDWKTTIFNGYIHRYP